MSSMQVDTRERGFSYAYDAPLDMRMDPEQELTAREIVNTWERRRLARALREYGEERYAERIAGADRPRAAARDHVRARRRDHRRDPRARALRRRPSRQAHVPGDPDRRQRGARPARRRAPAGVGAPPARRPARRDLVPLARGPARQALPRRPRARLHLPARPAGLRLRAHARGRARLPPLRRPLRRRGRGQPPLEVRSTAGCTQAQGGAADAPDHRPPRPRAHAAPAPARATPAASAARSPGPAARRRAAARRAAARTGVFERLRALPESRFVDRLLRGRAWIWLIGLMLGGIVAMQVSLLKLNSGISAQRRAGRRRSSASTPTSRPRSPSCPPASGSSRSPPRRGWSRRPPATSATSAPARRPTRGLAADRMQSPSDEAGEVMANGGRSLAPARAGPDRAGRAGGARPTRRSTPDGRPRRRRRSPPRPRRRS